MRIEFNTKGEGIDWGSKGMARRIQNINNALNTYRYEVAYDRTFGRDPANNDLPTDKFIQAVVAETYELISDVDPNARAIEVTPVMDEFGELNLKVVIEFE